MLSSYKSDQVLRQPSLVVDVEIDKVVPWGYFDGAYQGLDRSCGLGFILHLFDFHFIQGKDNMGQGTNNLVNSMIFFLFSKQQWIGVYYISSARDSKLVINCMRGKSQVFNLGLQPIVTSHLLVISTLFNQIGYSHIPRELNNVTNALSKSALHLQEGKFMIEEFSQDRFLSQRPWSLSAFL
jgi:hypothetical protein